MPSMQSNGSNRLTCILAECICSVEFFLLVGFLTLYRRGLSGTILMFQPMAAHLEKQTDPEKERYERLRFFVSSTLAVVW
jgi:hypothetical protein